MLGRGGVSAAFTALSAQARAAVTPPAELLIRNAWPEH